MPAMRNSTTQKSPAAPNPRADVHRPDPVPPPRGQQESQHNKHNHPGQDHHKPQKHSPDEEKP
jgi:hypothetical protein